jgi:hypothetical protein
MKLDPRQETGIAVLSAIVIIILIVLMVLVS